MRNILGISRQSYYYEPKKRQNEAGKENAVETIFNQNRKNYGIQKIEKELEKQGIILSRRKIGKIMKACQLTFNYTKARFKPIQSRTNNSQIANKLNRDFSNREPLKAIVIDLSYIRVGEK